MRVVRLRDELRMQNGTEPTVQQLSREMGVEENDIVQALCVSIPPVSLTDPEEGGEGQLDIPVPPPDTEIGDVLALRQIMQTLSEQDRLLLTMRYYQNKTQSQTAQALGMTQVQVSRREKKLLLAMREELLR